jgi:uncharacterized repeat protein (TIGR01451 family)
MLAVCPAFARQVFEDESDTAVGSGQRCSTPASRTLSVPVNIIIDDLDFEFRAAHSWRTDINLWLISPSGTRIDLLTGGYTTGWDNYNVRFDDEAFVQVDTLSHASNDSLTGPPNAVISEGDLLLGLDGENASGTWTIGYCDVFPVADNGTIQRVALAITGRPAVLDGDKSLSVWNPGMGGGFATPGSDVLYEITVTNTGPGFTDADSIVLIDALPPEMSFFNGDVDGISGPETDAVAFTDSGSGLSWDYARDVAFATGVAAPAGFAACSYNPTPGYDPNVTHVCINPKGQLATGTPDPSFTVSFRARIE